MDILQFMKRRADFQSLLLSAGTVVAGTAAAVVRGNMEVLAASVCLLFALSMQLGCNCYHSYLLMRRSEPLPGRLDRVRNEEQVLSLRVLREGSFACLIISLMLGLTIMTMSADFWWTIVVGVSIYGLVYLMTTGPRVYRNPLSLVITFLIFGPVGVMATGFLQLQHEAARSLWNFYDSSPCLFLGVAMGFLACSHHLVLAYFNYDINPTSSYRGCVRFFGRRGVILLTGLCGVSMLATVVWSVFSLSFPSPLIAVIPGFLGFALNTLVAFSMKRAGVGELHHLITLTRVNYFLTAVLFFVIWWVLGTPDDSMRLLF